MRMGWRYAVCLLAISSAAEARAVVSGPVGGGADLIISLQTLVQQLITPTLLCGGDEHQATPRAWFGIRFEAPGSALCKQLHLDGRGLLITNVCKESPAERSGLQQFDVMVSFSGQQLSHGGEELRTQMRAIGPAAEVHFLVLREAKELELSTKLASWPGAKKLAWIYETEPTVVLQDKFDISGQILHVGPNGKVAFRPLDVHALPQKYRTFLRGLQPRTIELWSEDGRTRVKCKTVKEDVVIEVERDADSQIYVRRIAHEGDDRQVTEEVYDNEQALEDADEEAYEVFKDCGTHHLFGGYLQRGQLPDVGGFWQNRNPFENIKQLYERNHSNLESLKVWHEKMSQGLEGVDIWNLKKLDDQLRRADELTQQANRWIEQYRRLQSNLPEYNFHVDSEGRVIVFIRKGDNELSKVFNSVEQLRQKSPDLFERFESIDSSE